MFKFSTLLVSAMAFSAMAEDPVSLDGRIGIGIAGGAQRYNGSYGNNIMPYGRAHVEYHINETFAARLIGGYGEISDGTNAFRTKNFGNVGVQGVYQPTFGYFESLRPYLAAGVSSDFGTANSYGIKVQDLAGNVYVPVELGLELLFGQRISGTVFLENRAYAKLWDKLDGIQTGEDFYHKRDDLIRAGLGLTWRFGGGEQELRAILPPQATQFIDSVRDADSDGVSDNLDNCQNTPMGVSVDGTGCPIDSDKDGVADHLDKCSETPAGVSVDESGCPVDSDKDGVADHLDKCPGSPEGEKVDSTGCVEIKFEKGTKLTLSGILFATGKADIDSSSNPVLVHAAEALKSSPKSKVEIAGFTDNAGKAKTNNVLSAKRAKAVQAYLVKLGVPAKQLTSKGYGPAQPVADNATEEGRAKNRRIEFRVK
ncbi:MAG TPA: OmpA family protein [Fibrobacteria bacterium]|nr:OmpA family protein [Fibrobacteria bacterium]HOX50939.1 OmpA family protein [Fibrobacteria bacterium]